MKQVSHAKARRRNGVMLAESTRAAEVTDILYAAGAYGRRPSPKDWAEGKDFYAIDPPVWKGTRYFSISEAEFIYGLGYRRIVFGGDEGFDVELVMNPPRIPRPT